MHRVLHEGLSLALLLPALGCAADDGAPTTDADDGAAPAVGDASSDGGAIDAAPERGADSAAPTEGGGAIDAAPDASAFAADKTPFATGAELCAWVNTNRQGYAPHDRWRGLPVTGEYHTNVTWPIAFTLDDATSALADAEAHRVAGGGAPTGTPIQLNFDKTLWFEGVSTASYTVTSRDVPGDWVPAQFTGDVTGGLTTGNPAARMGLYYHDPGGAGPVLTRIGCGAALAPDGQSRVWVIAFRP